MGKYCANWAQCEVVQKCLTSKQKVVQKKLNKQELKYSRWAIYTGGKLPWQLTAVQISTEKIRNKTLISPTETGPNFSFQNFFFDLHHTLDDAFKTFGARFTLIPNMEQARNCTSTQTDSECFAHGLLRNWQQA